MAAIRLNQDTIFTVLIYIFLSILVIAIVNEFADTDSRIS